MKDIDRTNSEQLPNFSLRRNNPSRLCSDGLMYWKCERPSKVEDTMGNRNVNKDMGKR